MAGISNEVFYGSNVDFSGGSPVAAQVTADGQLLIGSSVAPNIRVNTLTAGSGVTITNGNGTITIASTATGNVVGPGSSTSGDLAIYSGATGKIIADLATGANNTVLYSNSGTPTWGNTSGSLVLLSSKTASSSASISFTSFINAAYSSYQVKVLNVNSSAANTSLVMTLSTDNGSTYINSGYAWTYTYYVTAVLTGIVGSNSDSSSTLYNLLQPTSNLSGFIDIYNLNTSIPIQYSGQLNFKDAIDGDFGFVISAGANTGTTAINAIKFANLSGTISTGIFKLYGVVA